MNPGRTAKAIKANAPSRDEATPDYVLQFEHAASYLPAEQLPLLRHAWELGAAAHIGQRDEFVD